MNVNQEKAMNSFKPRKFQGYSVTIAIADSEQNHSDLATSPDVSQSIMNSDNPNNANSSNRMTVPAVSTNENPHSKSTHLRLPEHVAKKPRSEEEPVNASTRSNTVTDTALPNPAPQTLSSDKASTKAVPDGGSKALDRKALREWWVRERGIWLDI